MVFGVGYLNISVDNYESRVITNYHGGLTFLCKNLKRFVRRSRLSSYLPTFSLVFISLVPWGRGFVNRLAAPNINKYHSYNINGTVDQILTLNNIIIIFSLHL